MNQTMIHELRERFPALSMAENEPLARHTSFRIGGPAALVVKPSSAGQTAQLCRFLRRAGEKPLLLGRGTNVLVDDRAHDKIVLVTGEAADAVRVEGTAVTAECGALLSRTAAAAQEAGLAGLEFAAGIPGSIGGALYMNAGAYGGEMKQVVTRTDWLDAELVERTVCGAEHEFGYRQSVFMREGGIVLRTEMALAEDDPAAIAGRMRDLAAKRRASQPLELASAGSFFKRPEGAFAGALIEQAGLKGRRVGGARVSEKHAGFLVSDGTATFDDVLRLMELVQETVLRASGYALEPEVRIIRAE